MSERSTFVGRRGTVGEVFLAFLKLGLTSFGGPIAHLGYFREELVVRLQWVSEPAYAELVALCQFLPGPASSQTGFVLGLVQAGPLGALAAWIAFTLPSALLMLAWALGSASFGGDTATAVFHGLKLVALVVVAQAVWSMAKTLTPDLRRRAIAGMAALVMILVGGTIGQLASIAIGAGAGMLFCRQVAMPPGDGPTVPISRSAALACLAGFAGLLITLPLLVTALKSPGLQLFNIFYRAGALVFGGGHVVLPLLRAELVPTGLVDEGRFLAAYGAAQALPGPLFALSAYLGVIAGKSAWSALVAVAGIFLPGLLIVTGVLPFWAGLRTNLLARSAINGMNSAVVGILAVALYDPLWTGGVGSIADVLLVALGLVGLMRWRLPPIAVVAMLVAASAIPLALG